MFKLVEQRAQYRKNPWNLALLVLALFIEVLLCFALYQIIKFLFLAVLPSNTIWMWQNDQNSSIFALIVGVFPLSLWLSNLMAYQIPFLKRILDREAELFPEMSYETAQKALWPYAVRSLLIMLPVAAFCFLINLNYLSPNGIYSRQSLALTPMYHPLSDIQSVFTGVQVSGSKATFKYKWQFKDKATVELWSKYPEEFPQIFPKIQASLMKQSNIKYTYAVSNSDWNYLQTHYNHKFLLQVHRILISPDRS